VWNVAAKDAICGAPAQATSSGVTHCLACARMIDNIFITGGRYLNMCKLCMIRFGWAEVIDWNFLSELEQS
jgi:hypothetical protein